MRIRSIKPGFHTDRDIADLPPLVRLFYIGLWNHADKAGRLEDRPDELKARILPWDQFDPEEALQRLAQPKRTTGRVFITRYEIEGQHYIQIESWARHQKPHKQETESRIPGPPAKKKRP